MRFERAAGGEVLRVEVEHHPLAAVVLQIYFTALVARERDFGRGRADRRLIRGGGSERRRQHGRTRGGQCKQEKTFGHCRFETPSH